MASANLSPAVPNEELAGRPWPWLGFAIFLTFWSWLWTAIAGSEASDFRVLVLALGLLAGGIGIWLRWRDTQTIYWQTGRHPLMLALGALFFLLGVGIVVAFAITLFKSDFYDFKTAPMFLVMISAAPLAYFAARQLFRSRADDSSTAVAQESALAFAVGAVLCILGSFTLDAGGEFPRDWTTLRMFLRVVAAVCLFASALVVVSTAVRRVALSFLIAIHFTGICTAALSAAPSPWIVQQTWMRVFRPYLEFVYLNNAYHFYAPEPGPASYLWFRVIYSTPKGDQGEWYKVPGLDEKGRIKHHVALEYQRLLSLTESVGMFEPLPPEMQQNKLTNRFEPNPLYYYRMSLQPGMTTTLMDTVVGKVDLGKFWRIPLAQDMTVDKQVAIPNQVSRALLESYARFVAHKHATHGDPEKKDWQVKSIKIYRVLHWIPPILWFQNRFSPTDPHLYRPYYLGNYTPDGERLEDLDPYRFWMLPAWRKDPTDPESMVLDFARLHAGDENWVGVWENGNLVWTDPTQMKSIMDLLEPFRPRK